MAQHVARMRVQTQLCEYRDANDINENIRDHLVDTCRSVPLRKKLLEKGSALTLDKALQLARTMEAVDKVHLQQQKQNKLTTPYETVPYDVVERHGTQVTIASPEGVRYRRKISQVKRFLEPDPVMVVPQSPAAEDQGGCETDTSSATHTATTPLRGAIQTPVSTAVPQAAATPVRPSRNQKPPSRFKDFVID